MTRERDGRHEPRPPAGRHAAVEIGRLTAIERDRSAAGAPEPAPEPAAAPDDLLIDIRGDAPVTVRLAGDLDLRSAPALSDRLRELSGVDVVVECDGLRFVDSIGVSLLVRMHHEFETRGTSLRLRGVTGVPQRTLEILGLTDTFDIDLRES